MRRDLNLSYIWYKILIVFYLKLKISLHNLEVLLDGKNQMWNFLSISSHVVIQFEGSSFNHLFAFLKAKKRKRVSITYSVKTQLGINVSLFSNKFRRWMSGSLCDRHINFLDRHSNCMIFCLSFNLPSGFGLWMVEVKLVVSGIIPSQTVVWKGCSSAIGVGFFLLNLWYVIKKDYFSPQ